MFSNSTKRSTSFVATRLRRRLRARNKNGAFRLSIFKSNAHFYAQLIDDKQGVTLVSASSIKKKIDFSGKRQLNSGIVEEVARKFVKNCSEMYQDVPIFLDRGPYKYTGLVKIFADVVRSYGFKF